MSRTSPVLVIDARPRGLSGLLAGERVLGRPVIDHLVDLAESLGNGPVAIHARHDEHEHLAHLLAARPSSRYRLTFGPPPEGAAVLRSDRFYDLPRLRRALRRGNNTESAVIWRIDAPTKLAVAADEVERRRSFQPLGRYWATRPATALARALVNTRVRPNHLTIGAGTLMVTAAALVGFGHGLWLGQIVPAVAMALALVLDTSDGHLARLQGTSSEFGRWLDSYLDELGDMALHAAIAWSAYQRTGLPVLLATGMIYASAKYLYIFGSLSGARLEGIASVATPSQPGRLRSLVSLLGHADLRWHLWIVLAVMGRLDLALGFYTLYFLGRTTAGAIRKARIYAS
jgi:phosphatidylglycerophosphate synthase